MARQRSWSAALLRLSRRARISLLASVTVFFIWGLREVGAERSWATNLILGLNRAALAEGLVFAERLGLDLSVFLEVLKNSPAYSVAVDTKGERMRTGEFTPESRVHQHKKDVELILACAEAIGQGLPLSRIHHALLTEALEAGEGELDNAVIIQSIRRRV